MGEETLKQKTVKGIFWGGMSNGVQQLLGVVFGIILLKNLTPGDYGMVGMLAIFTGIAGTLLESGFTAALTNRPEFKDEDYNSVFWFNVIVGVTIYIILFFCAPLIANFYHQPALVLLSRVLFLTILFNAITIAHNAVLFKKLMVKERAIAEIIGTVISGILGILLAVNGYGYWALALQSATYIFIANIIRCIYCPWHPKWKFGLKPIREMFGFGFKLLFANIVSQIQINIFSILLGRFYTKTDVGYYSQGTKWTSLGAQFLTGAISGIAQPVLRETANDKQRQMLVFRKILRFIAFVSFPIMFGLAFIARDFIKIINPEFLPSVPILQLYCLSGAFVPMQILYSSVVVAHNRADIYFANIFVYAAAQIITALIILPYGIYWMAFAIVSTNLIYYLSWHYFTKKCIPINIKDTIKDIVPYIGITLLIFIISYFTSAHIYNIYLKLSTKISISVILYIIIMKYANSIIFKEALSYFKGTIKIH